MSKRDDGGAEMLDHITLPVSARRSLDLYLRALEPLHWGLVLEFTREQIPGLGVPWIAGLGPQGRPCLWLRPQEGPLTPIHVAVHAETRAEVDAFHRAAVQAGLRDNGGPGLRPQYTPTYYGAFVLDPDGHNLEAVCRAAE
jgi:catechol 2,3-dioxygenase-like lactoylglutathione lyase family enzyme